MSRASAESGELPGRAFVAALCGWGAALIPLGVAICSVSGAARWASDAALVRDLGLGAVGSEGALSTLLVQLAALAPVGGRVLRAGLVGSLALALASHQLYGLTLGLLGQQARRAIDPWLALLGSLLWALSPPVLELAVVSGSPLVGLALLLACLARLQETAGAFDARASATTGLLFGLTLAEHHAFGALLLAAAVMSAWAERASFESRRASIAGLGAFAALCACALVRWLPSASSRAELALGALPHDVAAAPSDLSTLQLAERLLGGLGDPLGWVPAGLGVAGLVSLLAAAEARRAALGMWVLLAVGSLAPVLRSAGAGDAAASLALCLGAALGAGVSACMRLAIGQLWHGRLPFARPASVLATCFAVTLVLQQTAARPIAPASLRAPSGAALWTDEALGKLPPHSALFVRTPELALRLLAARVVADDRPDVLLVPVPYLGRARWADGARTLEPAAAPVLRQLLANGSADEYSLARLADERPTFTEIDPAWDERQLEHLSPEGVWLGFSPHPLGSSDRDAGVERARALLRRVSAALENGVSFDEATRRAFGMRLREQERWLDKRGDEEDAHKLRSGARQLELTGVAAREPEPPERGAAVARAAR